MEDVRYVWKVPDPVQFAPNLFLPGGFDLANHQGGYCDVQTATGEKVRFEKRSTWLTKSRQSKLISNAVVVITVQKAVRNYSFAFD